MEKGIFSWFGYLMPMRERFRLIREAGFETVLLWWGSEFDSEPGEYLTHADLAGSYGLRVENAHLPYFTSNELWTGGAYETILLDGIRHAAERGVPVLVSHVSEGEDPPPPCEEGVRIFERAAELCEKTGVRLALENVRQKTHLDYVLSRIDSDKVGFCYDTGHARAVHGREHALLRSYGDRLMALHLHDNDGSGDQHRLPFDGDVDWSSFAAILPATAYRGSLTLEVDQADWQNPDRIGPEEYLREAFERSCRLEKMITHE